MSLQAFVSFEQVVIPYVMDVVIGGEPEYCLLENAYRIAVLSGPFIRHPVITEFPDSKDVFEWKTILTEVEFDKPTIVRGAAIEEFLFRDRVKQNLAAVWVQKMIDNFYNCVDSEGFDGAAYAISDSERYGSQKRKDIRQLMPTIHKWERKDPLLPRLMNLIGGQVGEHLKHFATESPRWREKRYLLAVPPEIFDDLWRLVPVSSQDLKSQTGWNTDTISLHETAVIGRSQLKDTLLLFPIEAVTLYFFRDSDRKDYILRYLSCDERGDKLIMQFQTVGNLFFLPYLCTRIDLVGT